MDESEELMSNLVIYRFNFLGSSAQKLPSMISVLSTFQREHPARKMVIHFGQAERCLRQKSWKVAFEPKNPES